MKLFPAPQAVNRPDDLLELARAVIDADVQQIEADPATPVSCSPGCSVCCHQMVPVSPAELRGIHAAIDAMADPQRRALRSRIAEAAARLTSAGFSNQVHATSDPAERRARAQRYFELRVMCPLLEGGVCSVRPARPLVCREYVVTSDPSHCAQLNESVVRIRPRRNVLRGFSELSRELGEAKVHILALALAAPPGDLPSARPVSGTAAVQLLTSQRLKEGAETSAGDGPAET